MTAHNGAGEPLRIILDTNVLISGLLCYQGPAQEIVDHWLANEFVLIASKQMLSECERILRHRNLQDSLGVEVLPTNNLMAMLWERIQVVNVVLPALTRVVPNPFDEILLASARAGNVAFLVTEEETLLTLGKYEGVTIVAPEQFINMLADSRHAAATK